ncbi:peptidylprolyl isomerase [Olsenella sp. An293]|uniref:FKBP-type peptidyl-prolyl cis-trans isomerase n=1 Tax=Olsenella sp. An293 TaxID=1965626 RepID=UPI000B39918D|nr:peptidylprolyl isomerase [Olsenella sp. An293]OUO32106.1 peptidylprolyl isomerase [Olsenella sp. An293]
MSNEGKKVKVHYVGTLDDGTKFDSSRDRNEPLAFTCMAGQMIPGFDAAVREMEVGQVIDIRLEPADAYGERDERLVQTVPVSAMPGAEELSAGDRVMLTSPMGQPFPATVASVEDGNITFDMNHEMAGKALNFNIELLEVEE